MSKTFDEALADVKPFITHERAAQWAMLDTDHALWVENEIMVPAGINSSVSTNFGMRLCDSIELVLEALHIENMGK